MSREIAVTWPGYSIRILCSTGMLHDPHWNVRYKATLINPPAWSVLTVTVFKSISGSAKQPNTWDPPFLIPLLWDQGMRFSSATPKYLVLHICNCTSPSAIPSSLWGHIKSLKRHYEIDLFQKTREGRVQKHIMGTDGFFYNALFVVLSDVTEKLIGSKRAKKKHHGEVYTSLSQVGVPRKT